MKNVLLTSGGMKVREQILNIFPKKVAGDTKIAYVTTALLGNFEFDENRDADVKELKLLGYQIYYLDIKGKSPEELRAFMVDKDILWIRGGNSYYLLKHIKESGFDKTIIDFIDSGKTYIGVSAGSYILCPTIEMSTEENKVGLLDLSALSIVSFLIKAHYKIEDENMIKEKIKSSTYPVKIITDNQAILVKDDVVLVVGEGQEINL